MVLTPKEDGEAAEDEHGVSGEVAEEAGEGFIDLGASAGGGDEAFGPAADEDDGDDEEEGFGDRPAEVGPEGEPVVGGDVAVGESGGEALDGLELFAGRVGCGVGGFLNGFGGDGVLEDHGVCSVRSMGGGCLRGSAAVRAWARRGWRQSAGRP